MLSCLVDVVLMEQEGWEHPSLSPIEAFHVAQELSGLSSAMVHAQRTGKTADDNIVLVVRVASIPVNHGGNKITHMIHRRGSGGWRAVG